MWAIVAASTPAVCAAPLTPSAQLPAIAAQTGNETGNEQGREPASRPEAEPDSHTGSQPGFQPAPQAQPESALEASPQPVQSDPLWFTITIFVAAVLSVMVIWSARLITPDKLAKGRDVAPINVFIWVWAAFGVFFLNVLGAGVGQGISAALVLDPIPESTLLNASSAVCAILATLGIAVLLAYMDRENPRKVGLWVSTRDLATGTFSFLLALPIIIGSGSLAVLVATLLGHPPTAAIAHNTLQQITDSWSDPWVWGLVFAVAVLTPIAEECLFRGCLQSALRRFSGNPIVGVVLTSLVFTSLHWAALPPGGRVALVQIFVLSLSMGLAYERTGRLGTPIVMHILFNTTMVGVAALTAAPGTDAG